MAIVRNFHLEDGEGQVQLTSENCLKGPELLEALQRRFNGGVLHAGTIMVLVKDHVNRCAFQLLMDIPIKELTLTKLIAYEPGSFVYFGKVARVMPAITLRNCRLPTFSEYKVYNGTCKI